MYSLSNFRYQIIGNFYLPLQCNSRQEVWTLETNGVDGLVTTDSTSPGQFLRWAFIFFNDLFSSISHTVRNKFNPGRMGPLALLSPNVQLRSFCFNFFDSLIIAQAFTKFILKVTQNYFQYRSFLISLSLSGIVFFRGLATLHFFRQRSPMFITYLMFPNYLLKYWLYLDTITIIHFFWWIQTIWLLPN